MSNKIGFNIESARKLLGLSQSELAIRLGTSQPQVNRIEKGQNITINTLYGIAEALGVEPAELLK